MSHVLVKINNPALAKAMGYTTDKHIEVEVSRTGIPKNKEWRNRFRDAEHDSCITIVTPTKKKTTTKEAS